MCGLLSEQRDGGETSVGISDIADARRASRKVTKLGNLLQSSITVISVVNPLTGRRNAKV